MIRKRTAIIIAAVVTTAISYSHAQFAGSKSLEPGLAGRSDVIIFEDFERSTWYTTWGLSSDKATSSVAFKGNRSLKAFVRKGSHEAVNFMFPLSKASVTDRQELYFRYYVYFDATWTRDPSGQVGKMPGFYGDKSASGCTSSRTTWSARGINADKGGSIQEGYYVYHANRKHSDNCGDSYHGSNYIPKGRWGAVEGYIKLNTIGQTNGILRQWVNGTKNVDASGFKFVLTSSSSKVKGIWFHVYVGGSWTAPRDMACYFDNLVVATKPIGLYSSTQLSGSTTTGLKIADPADPQFHPMLTHKGTKLDFFRTAIGSTVRMDGRAMQYGRGEAASAVLVPLGK